MEITISLTKAEQALLLANEGNDQRGWSSIARKIEQARDGGSSPRVMNKPRKTWSCSCCVDNECECEGTNLERDKDVWSCTCCLSNDCECNGMRVVPEQYRELANAIAQQAKAIAMGTIKPPLHGAVARLVSNAETLRAWTPDDRT